MTFFGRSVTYQCSRAKCVCGGVIAQSIMIIHRGVEGRSIDDQFWFGGQKMVNLYIVTYFKHQYIRTWYF